MSKHIVRLALILGSWLVLAGGMGLTAPLASPPLPPITPMVTDRPASVAVPVASSPTQADNLVQNGGFEEQGANWESCGNVGLADAQVTGADTVYTGRYAAFMGARADSSDCPQLPDTSVPRQLLSQELSIPAGAEAVTVSFWFRSAAGAKVEVFLARGLYQFDPNLGGVRLGSFATDQPPGWQLYRTVLTDDALEQVRGQAVRFSIVIQGNTEVGPEAALLIDDVRVRATDGRTAPSSPPAALRGDGSRPLAAIRAESGGERWLYRLDLDGGNPQLIYRGLLGNVRHPAWSPDGQRLAVADRNTWPWPTPDPDPQSNLSAAAVTVLNADGSGAQQVYQTQSRKGSRCPFIPSPGQREEPSQIWVVSAVHWMPDNRRVAFTQVGFNAFCDNSMRGGIADVLLSPTPPALVAPPLATFATNPSINRSGQLLFDSFDLGRTNRAAGVWLIEPNGQAEQGTHLLPNSADREPVWAPDGRRFAVVRVTTSPSSDARARTFAIMLYDRQDLANPRMLLFADHGESIGRLSWSPDGAYLVYTLNRFDGRSDIWWLEVASGATGPVTTDGSWVEAAWRPSASGAGRAFLPLVVRP